MIVAASIYEYVGTYLDIISRYVLTYLDACVITNTPLYNEYFINEVNAIFYCL